MNRWQILCSLLSALKDKQHFGDVTVLKVALLGQKEEANVHTASARALIDANFCNINVAELASLPPQSFGHHYYQFLKRNKLTPLHFSRKYLKIIEKYPVTCRYNRIHDMVHTLLGFETNFAGELGVYAFIKEQHYSSVLDKAADTAAFLAKLLKPRSLKQVREASQRGLDLSKGAKPLISVKFEELFAEDIEKLRQELVPAFKL